MSQPRSGGAGGASETRHPVRGPVSLEILPSFPSLMTAVGTMTMGTLAITALTMTLTSTRVAGITIEDRDLPSNDR